MSADLQKNCLPSISFNSTLPQTLLPMVAAKKLNFQKKKFTTSPPPTKNREPPKNPYIYYLNYEIELNFQIY